MAHVRGGAPSGQATQRGRNAGMKKRLLLGAAYSSIEPLGLLYLAGLARDLGWEAHIRLVRNHDFTEFHEAVEDLRPDVVGFTLYTGNHEPLYRYFDRLRKERPQIQRVIGGPHATYFPARCVAHADYVVVSEGFDALARILRGEAAPGILYPRRIMPFPQPDRRRFYQDYPGHRRNPIKNVISMTGCPFACTYCYNSSSLEGTLGKDLPPQDVEQLRKVLRPLGRLFPLNFREVDSVLQELREILELAPETQLVYWQDDTLGVARHFDFLQEFARRCNLGLRFHGQTRFEMIDPATERGRAVLETLRRIGFDGLTMAIEAAEYAVRREVLNRAMTDDVIFRGVRRLAELGFRLRTEQMTGLPYGATSVPTLMNLDADLAILKLNMDLRRQTGLPHIAWATTLLPYLGTRMSEYCLRYGFISERDAENPEAGYHERSVLRHLRAHVGPSLAQRKDEAGLWLSPEEQERYRDQNTHLRYHFHVLAYLSVLPDAEAFVARHLRERTEFSIEALNEDLREFLRTHPCPEGRRLWERVVTFEAAVPALAATERDRARLRRISAYGAVLPGDGRELARRYLAYTGGKDDVGLFSTIIRKYLFDTQLYLTRESTCEVYDGGSASPAAG